MSNVMFTTNEADAEVVGEIEQSYAARSGAMSAKVEALLAAASRGDESWSAAREDLSTWAAASVTPALQAEATHIHTAAKQLSRSRALAEAISAGCDALTSLLRDVAAATDAVRAAASARAARSVFDLHVDNMTSRLVPLLAAESGVSLADLWSRAAAETEMSGADSTRIDAATGSSASAQTDNHAHSCACGESDGPEHPELDVRTVPHAIRHATVFGALDSVSSGAGMILVAPHDPLPLLAQIEQRYSGGFSVDYIQRGPEAWRLEFIRA